MKQEDLERKQHRQTVTCAVCGKRTDSYEQCRTCREYFCISADTERESCLSSLVLWPWRVVQGCAGCFGGYFIALYLAGLVVSPALWCTLIVLVGGPLVADAYLDLPSQVFCIAFPLALVILVALGVLTWVLFVVISKDSQAHFDRERNGCGWQVPETIIVDQQPVDVDGTLRLVDVFETYTGYYCGKHAPGLSNLWRRSGDVTP